MPRILITGFCALPGPNRAGIQMQHIVQALARYHTVDVLVLRHAEQAYVERQGNARILRVPISEEDVRGQVEAFRRALKRQLDGADYDIVHFRDGWTGKLILEMRDRLEYATVFDAARAPLTELPLLNLELASELGSYEEACLAQANLVLMPSDAARDHLARSLGGNASERIFTVPPGVDIDLFDWDDRPSATPIVLYAGSIMPGRGIRVLMRSMVYVTQQVDARLLVAGHAEPRFRTLLEHAISELGLTGKVDLLGEIDHAEMASLIARASICVASSAPELHVQPLGLFPTKLLEYMACKRAVVAPMRSAAGALIEDGVHGLLFNPGDPADLSIRILKILCNPELEKKLGNAGYERVRRDYTAASTRRGLRKAYDYLIQLAPWGQKISDILDEPSHPSRLVGPEDLSDSLSDNTDEYEPPFSLRVSLGSAGDVTTVAPAIKDSLDSDELDSGAWELTGSTDIASTDLATREPAVAAQEEESVDDWVVAEQPMAADRNARPWIPGDEEGTPVDVEAAPARPGNEDGPEEVGEGVEDRFVAGELEVADPPDLASELENNASFTAVSVLLGNTSDDTAETLRKADPPARTHRRARTPGHHDRDDEDDPSRNASPDAPARGSGAPTRKGSRGE